MMDASIFNSWLSLGVRGLWDWRSWVSTNFVGNWYDTMLTDMGNHPSHGQRDIQNICGFQQHQEDLINKIWTLIFSFWTLKHMN